MSTHRALVVIFLLLISVNGDSHSHPRHAGEVIDLTDGTFEHDTQASSGATTGDWFVKLYAPWCGHCKKLAPIWADVAKELKGSVNVAHVDCTKERGLAQRFAIKSYPTLLFFHNGKMYKYTGERSFDSLVAFAKHGYHDQEGTPVPQPESPVAKVKREVKKTASDISKIVGEAPIAAISIFCSGAFGGLVFGFIVAYSITSYPKGNAPPERRPTAEDRKNK
eukprot:GHVN01001463.1.p3 GENE.GHVN01001463.1~~GHVN01001463.1.p3  ORF type:complete len:222 (-),score=25.91 GHVN01001463.1:5794-6459(-)